MQGVHPNPNAAPTITGNINGIFLNSFFNQSLDQLNISVDKKIKNVWDCRINSFKEYEAESC